MARIVILYNEGEKADYVRQKFNVPFPKVEISLAAYIGGERSGWGRARQGEGRQK